MPAKGPKEFWCLAAGNPAAFLFVEKETGIVKTVSFPKPSGRRVYLDAKDLRVPVREISLPDPQDPVRLYDTSGPYGDASVTIDLDKGLPRLRTPWILDRGDVEGASRPRMLRQRI